MPLRSLHQHLPQSNCSCRGWSSSMFSRPAERIPARSSAPNSLPKHVASTSKLGLDCRVLRALEKLTGAFAPRSDPLNEHLAIRLEPARGSTKWLHLGKLLCRTAECGIQRVQERERSSQRALLLDVRAGPCSPPCLEASHVGEHSTQTFLSIIRKAQRPPLRPVTSASLPRI